MGHIVDELDGAGELPDPSEIDLVIHTNAGAVTPPTKFVTYPVPLITFNADNHDDTLISTIGAVAAVDPPVITVVEANKDHPVLGGKTGSIPWTDGVFDLQGIGATVPTGATVLATYIDPNTELELPAIVLVEDGGNLLGAFGPEPEGVGFFVGASTDDADFGEGASTPEVPKALQLNPVNVAGQENVKVAVGLAATGVDFEDTDFLRVLYAPDSNSDFEVLTEFIGVNDATSPNNKALSNGELVLSPDEFRDITLDIPDGATDLVIRFEVHNTFPNEIVAIDNVRILSGTALPGDCNGDGVVNIQDANCTPGDQLDAFLASLDPASLRGDADGDGQVQFSDFVILSENFTMDGQYTDGDFDKDGVVQFSDFVILSESFGQMGGAVASAVPEPNTGNSDVGRLPWPVGLSAATIGFRAGARILSYDGHPLSVETNSSTDKDVRRTLVAVGGRAERLDDAENPDADRRRNRGVGHVLRLLPSARRRVRSGCRGTRSEALPYRVARDTAESGRALGHHARAAWLSPESERRLSRSASG